MNVLAQINEKVGFERLIGLNHLDVYYQGTTNWDEAPKVVDGASDFNDPSTTVYYVYKTFWDILHNITL